MLSLILRDNFDAILQIRSFNFVEDAGNISDVNQA
jgi:hypothetical protein